VTNLKSGWCTEFPIRPDCDITLFEKYYLGEAVQVRAMAEPPCRSVYEVVNSRVRHAA